MASSAERLLIAAELWKARRDRTTIRPPSTRFDFNLDDGYAVSANVYARRIEAGARRAGLKIGFTNTAVWASLGLGEPICAVVYDTSVRDADARTETVVDIAPFVAPKIEPEIVLGIASNGVAWWALGFEIVDCHYPAWTMTPADALADGGVHGALVIGARIPLATDAHALRSPFRIELERNDRSYEASTTSAVLGGPLQALERATAICANGGILISPQPGDVVTTGSLTSAPLVAVGETWTVRAERDAPPLRIRVRSSVRTSR